MKISRKFLKDLRQHLSVASNVAQLIVQVRDKPNPLDWVCIATRALDIALQTQENQARSVLGGAYSYFARNRDLWTPLSMLVTSYAYDTVSACHVDENIHLDQGDGIWFGEIGDVKVAWKGPANRQVPPLIMYVAHDQLAELTPILARRIWAAQGTKSLKLAKGKLMPATRDTTLCHTALVNHLLHRIVAFRPYGARSYLLAGPPGVGKTCAARAAVEALGLTSLQIPHSALGVERPFESEMSDVDQVVAILRPDVILLDDIDHMHRDDTQVRLMHFLEEVREYTNVILCTANDLPEMRAPLLRPGRIDDMIAVERLDTESVKALAPAQTDCERIAHWPVAYITDLRRRADALGPEGFAAELRDLESRIPA